MKKWQLILLSPLLVAMGAVLPSMLAWNLDIDTKIDACGTYVNSTEIIQDAEVVDENFTTTFSDPDSNIYVKIEASDAFPSKSFNWENASIEDSFTNKVELAKVRRVAIHNRGTSSAQIIDISGNMMGTIGDGVQIGPGGNFVWEDEVNGSLVTASTKDTMTLTTSVSGIPYTVSVIGESQ